MITNVEMDIFKMEGDAIIHQCNCFGKMGGGIARLIRDRYPEAASADQHTTCGDKAKMGHYSCVKAHDDKYIYNLYSQYRYGTDMRHTDYEAFFNGMTGIRSHLETVGLRSASVPYFIGCGLGGGDWRIIETMLKVIFEDWEGTLFICKLP